MRNCSKDFLGKRFPTAKQNETEQGGSHMAQTTDTSIIHLYPNEYAYVAKHHSRKEREQSGTSVGTKQATMRRTIFHMQHFKLVIPRREPAIVHMLHEQWRERPWRYVHAYGSHWRCDCHLPQANLQATFSCESSCAVPG